MGHSLALSGLEIVAKQCGLEPDEVLKERLAKMEAVVQSNEANGTKLVPPLCETGGKMPALRSESPGETPRLRPEAILARYRLALYGDAITVDIKDDGAPGQRGFSREEVLSVIQAGGKVPAAQLIRRKVRHFVDGVSVGSKSFVESVFQGISGLFGPKRKDGARPMRSLPGEDRLFTPRDLRKSVLS